MFVIRVIMPWAMERRNGEDVCGWSMATAESVIISSLKRDRAQTMKSLLGTKRKGIRRPRSRPAWSKVVNRPSEGDLRAWITGRARYLLHGFRYVCKSPIRIYIISPLREPQPKRCLIGPPLSQNIKTRS